MSPGERWAKQHTIYDELWFNLPASFSTDKTCSLWPDKWNGVIYKNACLVHDYLYNEGRIHEKYHKLSRKRCDKILAYGVARAFRQQGKSPRMAGLMYRGLRMFGGVAWRKNGKRMRRLYPLQWARYHGYCVE